MAGNIFTTAVASVSFLTKINFATVDLRRSEQRVALHETLCELGTPIDVADAFIENVSNILEGGGSASSAREERDRLGLKHIAYGFYSKSGKLPVTYKRDGDTFNRASDADYEVVAKRQGELGDQTAPIQAEPKDEKPEDSSDAPKDSDTSNPPNAPKAGGDSDEDGADVPVAVPAKPRLGDSEDARKAAEAGSVAAELAVDLASEDEDEDDEDGRD